MLGNRTKAWTYFNESLSLISDQPDNNHIIARCHYSLGCIVFDQERFEEALVFFNKAVESFSKFKTPPAVDLVEFFLY